MPAQRRRGKKLYRLREITVGRVELCLLLDGLPFPLIHLQGLARWVPWLRRRAILEAATEASTLMGLGGGKTGGAGESMQESYYSLLTSICQLSHAKNWTPAQVRALRYKEFNYLVYILHCDQQIQAGKKITVKGFKKWQDGYLGDGASSQMTSI